MTGSHSWLVCSRTTAFGVRKRTTYSFMRFILVLATALLKTVGLGDMSAAALAMVLVSEKSMHVHT